MTTEHLRPLLQGGRGLRLLGEIAKRLAREEVPAGVMRLVRGVRLTALPKNDGEGGGGRGGGGTEAWWPETSSEDWWPGPCPNTSRRRRRLQLLHTNPPFDGAGCECVAHALRGLVELDPDSTMVSIDGISAYDLISRESITGLFRMRPDYFRPDVPRPAFRVLVGGQSRQRPHDTSGRTERARGRHDASFVTGWSGLRAEKSRACVEGRWGAQGSTRHQGVGHSIGPSPPGSRARATRASEKDSVGERSTARVINLVARQQEPTTSSDP